MRFYERERKILSLISSWSDRNPSENWAEEKEGESGNSGRPEKQRAGVVAGGGALRTLDWDTSAINLSV